MLTINILQNIDDLKNYKNKNTQETNLKPANHPPTVIQPLR